MRHCARGEREPFGLESVEKGRESDGDALAHHADMLRSHQDLHAGTPLMITRTPRVESENLRPLPEEASGVRHLDQRSNHSPVELSRERQT